MARQLRTDCAGVSVSLSLCHCPVTSPHQGWISASGALPCPPGSLRNRDQANSGCFLAPERVGGVRVQLCGWSPAGGTGSV